MTNTTSQPANKTGKIKILTWFTVTLGGIWAISGCVNSFSGFLSNITKTFESTLNICENYEIPTQLCDYVPKGRKTETENTNRNPPASPKKSSISFRKVEQPKPPRFRKAQQPE